MTTGVNVIDGYLPTYDMRSAHQVEVNAPVADTYRAARELDVGRSIPILTLFAIRAIPHMLTGKARPSRSITLQTVLDAGSVILAQDEPNGFVMGAVGKFWRPDSGMLRIAPDEFESFEAPGYAKGILSFSVDERGPTTSLLATETRVACTDESARRKFSLYWRAIGPFSGVIRHLMLQEVKRTAEAVAPSNA